MLCPVVSPRSLFLALVLVIVVALFGGLAVVLGFFYVYKCFSCLYVCAPWHATPEETRKCWESNSGPPEEQPVLSNDELPLQPLLFVPKTGSR